ncbi:sulfate transporter family-domain-containing protein [Kickxella alabastrina]|uniref:sulfate transporter family-domain-containing protein n=1 Tax=Kickxella alabastrina TaxID=61397 RepID=UPI00222023DD|nr:sulfate transporter family-domain-containing protein [Kickxella alabastrina]KAI7831968.1 sulfate transporter family-domain-containing protein [Kickxella alabastrina]
MSHKNRPSGPNSSTSSSNIREDTSVGASHSSLEQAGAFQSRDESMPLLPGQHSPLGELDLTTLGTSRDSVREHDIVQPGSRSRRREYFSSSRAPEPTRGHTRQFSARWWKRRARYYVPIVGWLPNYNIGNLATDVKAGFMVACLLVPQALSYSSLTNLRPVYGLYTALVPALVYGMLGTSRHLSMGPEALVSVLTGTIVKSQLKHLFAAYSPNTPPDDTIDAFSSAVASTVALVSGAFTFALGMFRFGFLDSMISESSLRGFISGAAIVVLIGQSRIVLGLPAPTSVHTSPWNELKFMLSNLDQIHVMTAAISLGALVFLRLLRIAKSRFKSARWLQGVPDTLLVIILATLVSWLAKLKVNHAVNVFGHVDGDLPHFGIPKIPALVDTKDIVSSGITITMIGVVESVIVAREYASRNHYAVSSNRELVALGISNIVGSAFAAYPAFGSLSRSKLNDRAKARSQMSGIVTTLLVLVSLLRVLPYLYHLPLGVLAAIIVDAVTSLLEATPGAISFLFKVGAWSDLFLLLFICASSVVASVETGILLAVVISLVMVIKRSNMPRIKLLGRSTSNDQEFHPIDGVISRPNFSSQQSLNSIGETPQHTVDAGDVEILDDSDNASEGEEETRVQHIEGVLIVRVDEPLYFANAGQLHARLNRLELYGDMRVHPSEDPRMKPTRAVVFDLIGMSDIDGSALEILLNIVREYSRRQVRVAFARVCDGVRERFRISRMAEAGGEHGFNDIRDALAYLEQQLTVSVVTQE